MGGKWGKGSGWELREGLKGVRVRSGKRGRALGGEKGRAVGGKWG